MSAYLENSAVATKLEKVSFHSSPKERNVKECSDYHTIVLISHANKVMLKILQARLQQYVNREFSDLQTEFQRGRGTRDQIANILWFLEKSREFQKHIHFSFTDYTKAFVCADHNKLWKILRLEYQITLPVSWEVCVCFKRQQLDQMWNNGLVQNWKRNMTRLYSVTLFI